MHRLETPARLAELTPPETLARLGLSDSMTLADIGAGTGIFTTAAAAMTRAKVFAVEPSAGMRTILEEKKNDLGLQQVEIVSDVLELPKQSVDLALLSTVLHEIHDQEAFMKQIASCLKPSGKLAVIDFHKQPTPYGPPPEIRISPEDVLRLSAPAGFVESERFSLAESYYCVCLQLGGD